MSDKLRIWDALGKTDPRETKPFKRSGGFAGTAIRPMWINKRMTEFFGPVGSGWGMSKPEFTTCEAAGEMLVFSAADFEDFRQPRPDMPPQMEPELDEVVRILAQNRWPWRLHATYDETISRALDVFERVNQDIPLEGLNWFFDHAETISDKSIDRIAALGGGIAVQHRMAYQGEYFIERVWCIQV